ncbi:hypothetical protein [Paraglaciecola sp.]|uniref:hypothetical protein n=1 Tax=Paraglaciecola sp. TaxID=1920173 RepID=UPI00273DA9A9|nr:hypothetical protein [Paraglaciecola sp.]MDP5032666.1 hypothetical protein [Paraglaciecola sp.]
MVADTVRTLAKRKEQTTTSIQRLIERLQNGTTLVVNSMKKASVIASDSLAPSIDASVELKQINPFVGEMSELTGQIAAAAEE